MNEPRTRRGDHLRLLTAAPDHRPGAAGPRDYHTRSKANSSLGPIRVLIAAGHALVRAGYRALLDSDDRIEVVAEAADRHDVIRLAAETEPHVALLDLALSGFDDPRAICPVVSHPALAGVAVMLIAPPNSDEHVLGALRAGATAVLANDAEPAELIGAVELLVGGKALLPAGAMRRLLQELAPHSMLDSKVAERFKELTAREREVVALAATGLTNAEIAERLVISTATAKTHVSRAMMKLQARHRAQLVAIAYEAGLVRVNGDADAEVGASSAPRLHGVSHVVGSRGTG